MLEADRRKASSLGPQWEWTPATPAEFVESPMFLGGAGDIWPVVKQDFVAFFEAGKAEGIFDEAIGAGKSHLASLIAAYATHRVLCLKSPQETLGFAAGSKLACLNMGTTGKQAAAVVFSYIKARVDACPWFRLHGSYDPALTSELRFPKQVYILPGNSKATTPLGYNLFCAILDEAAWFTDKNDHSVAEDIYLAMQRRLESRLGRRWPWFLVAISSPKYEGDFIEKKMEDPDCFRVRRTLWEAKPWQYAEPFVDWADGTAGRVYSIPRSLLGLAQKKPIKFKRDFMAVPSMVLEPYFPVPALVDAGVDARLRWQDNGALPDDLRPGAHAYVFHIDLGLTRDAAGLALGHREGKQIIYDFLWRICPGDGREVNFAAIRECVLALRARGFKFAKGSYDGWQSVDSVQLLTAKGLDVETLSVDRTLEPYDTLNEAISGGHARYPPHPTALRELKALEFKSGKKVDHPPTGSKDVADAMAGVAYWLRSMTPARPQPVLVQAKARSPYGRGPYS